MSAIDDGGAAFPMAGDTSNWDEKKRQYIPQHGMTMRDWFAGQALNGYLASWENEIDCSFFDPHNVAKSVYAFADAMLAARKGGAND